MAVVLPDSHFVAQFPVQEYIVDKDTGFPLAAGVVTYYEDEARTVLKPVYQQVQLPDNTYSFVELNNPITLTSVGTFSDDNGNDIIPFLFPYKGTPEDPGEIELYYITVYSSGGVLQFTREAWPPNIGTGSVPVTTFEASINQLDNPQFVEVLFQPTTPGGTTYTYNVSGTMAVDIAPDWAIVTTGSGTVTVYQVAISDPTIVSNPPYALGVSSTGVTTISLRQRLDASPRLLYGGFISGYFEARGVLPTTTSDFTMTYVPSTSPTATSFTIIDDKPTLADHTFTEFSGTVEISGTGSTATAPTGYVDIIITWTPNSAIEITSLQIVEVQTIDDRVQFLQQSTADQINRLFHYYKPQLEYKQIPSYLIGWDFPFNPAQFAGGSNGAVSTVATGANGSFYVWDQTICFQTVNSGMSFLRNNANNGLECVATLASSFALIQYLPAEQARELLSQHNAIALKGQINSGTINGTVSLYWTTDSSLPDLKPSNFDSLVATITAGVPAVPTSPGVNGSWTIIPRDTLGNTPNFTLTTISQEFKFTGFDATATAGRTTATYLAIVICFDTLTLSNNLTIEYCSLMGGDIATRPAPQSYNAVLNDCAYFYQRSFQPGTTTANHAGLNLGEAYGIATTGSGVSGSRGPLVTFPVPLRSTPIIALYNPGSTGSNSEIFNITTSAACTASSNSSGSTRSFYTSATNAAGGGVGDLLAVNWTADARLGVVL